MQEACESLYNETRKLHNRWGKCRRFYKWLSAIPLFLSGTCAASSVFLVTSGSALLTGGVCLEGVGHGMGTTTTHHYLDGQYQKTETVDHGACCKSVGYMLMMAGSATILAGVICYLLAWLFLGCSGVHFYEQVKFDGPLECYTMVEKVEQLSIYPEMNRYSAAIGTVTNKQYIFGKVAYTGWIKTSEGWIPSQTAFGFATLKKVEFTDSAQLPEGVEVFGGNVVTFDEKDDENFIPDAKVHPVDIEQPALKADTNNAVDAYGGFNVTAIPVEQSPRKE